MILAQVVNHREAGDWVVSGPGSPIDRFLGVPDDVALPLHVAIRLCIPSFFIVVLIMIVDVKRAIVTRLSPLRVIPASKKRELK